MGSFPVMFSQIERMRPTPKSNQKVGSLTKKQEYHEGTSIGVDQETNENSNIGLNLTSGDEPNIGAKKASMLTVLSNPTPQFNAESTNCHSHKRVGNAAGTRPQTRGEINNSRAKPLLTN